jgi:quaternary ammonium compound-resistance protein SugE
LTGKTGAIKGDLAIADGACKPHIQSGRTAFHIIIRGDDPALLGGFVMAWAVLFTAGLLEIGWAIGLKYTEGFTRLLPSVLTLAAMAGSIILLGLALKTLPIGTAYAVWTGIGAVGTAILGIALFGEPATAARLASIGLIVAGIAGLKLVS